MREWIRFNEPRAKRYHAKLSEGSIDGGAPRIVTVCGRSFDYGAIRDAMDHPPFRCAACVRRLDRVPYLVPAGREVEDLMRSRQLKLIEVRQRVLAQEAREGRKNIARLIRSSEQRARGEQR